MRTGMTMSQNFTAARGRKGIGGWILLVLLRRREETLVSVVFMLCLTAVTYTDLTGEIVVVDLTGEESDNAPQQQAVPGSAAQVIEVLHFTIFIYKRSLLMMHYRQYCKSYPTSIRQ